MKIAVPVENDNLVIETRTGQAYFFAIFENENFIELIPNPKHEHQHHSHDNQEHLNQHKNQLRQNLINLVLYIIRIESKWDPLAKNTQWSSALGIWQWLTKNYWKKVYDTSSFQTTLNYIYLSYPQKITSIIKNFPISKVTKNYTKLPTDFDRQEQVKILTLSLWATKREKLKEYVALALTWNIWGIKKIYEIFHHTKPTQQTLKLIKQAESKYYKKLKKFI